ncbi:MAG: cardiolipin synthase ClsB [Proteobacteria bacterium]|nr:cardiolipin synthase ClsB [Pseudomonadota bacterium]
MKFVPGNRLTLLRNGEQYFPALVGAIDAARREVFFETYIFADDETGSLVADALARAAARGVAVHVTVDGFGARDFAPRFRAMLEEAGAQVLVFRPKISPLTLRRNRLRRMHRKLVVVDALCAFVGGINILDDFDAEGRAPPRYDYAVRIEGPLVHDVWHAAASLWARLAWLHFRRRWPLRGKASPVCEPLGTQSAALVVRDNFRHRRDIELGYLEQIAAAKGEVLIAVAYFLPGRRFRRALVEAAQRGVRVVLLVQGISDHPVMHYASRALFGSFLEAGIEIHEHAESELHAKVAVFDGVVACVGSSNIDPFSLLLAREANVFVSDGRFASSLRASVFEAIDKARPVPPQEWDRQSLLTRARIWVAYGISRLLMSLSRIEGWH